MARYLILALVVGFGLGTLDAQTFSIRHDFDGASQSENGGWVEPQDQGYLVIQSGFASNDSARRICFTGIDAQSATAVELNSMRIPTRPCFVGAPNGPTRSPSGHIYVCGGSTEGERLSALAWRFNEALDSLWSSELFPDSTDNSIGRTARTASEACYCTGGIWHPSDNGQVFLTKLDLDGQVLWMREYGTSVRDEGYSLDTTSDGGFILGGQSRTNESNWQCYIIKADSMGNEEWHQYLGGPYKDGWANVICTADSEYVSVGSYATYQTENTTNKRLYAARLNTDGEVEWERQYAVASEVNELSSVTELADGTYIAPGIYYDTTSYKGVLLHFDQNGDSLWMRTYQHPPLTGVFSVHWLYHVIQDLDGWFVATGSCNDGEQDLWVIKVDSFGCLVPGCQLYDNIAEQGIELNVLVYPNPASDRLFISFRSAITATGEFTLLNATGQMVQRFSPSGRSSEIDLDISPHLPGLYMLSYADVQGERWSQRIIIERP